MYTTHTYQDWLSTTEQNRPALAREIVRSYCAGAEFRRALTALDYFRGENTAIRQKMLLKPVAVTYRDDHGRTRKRSKAQEIAGNQVSSSFLFRFVTQRSQTLLSNGVTLEDAALKARLGPEFDGVLQQLTEHALCQGHAYLFWNADHAEPLYAAVDGCSGFVALLDETTGAPMVGLHFWRLNEKRPQYIRVFEPEGVAIYRIDRDGGVQTVQERRAYKQLVRRDALGEEIIGAQNYAGALPIVPLYADDDKAGMLTQSLKTKIDAYDRIQSDFADNLDRANDVYWVLNNFGGTTDDIVEMLEQINRIKAVANISDGTGSGSTAEPHTIEVPYEARRVALDLLERAMYADAMALDMDQMTGGSLTNVAIKAASYNLNIACDRLEWQVRKTVQGVLRLLGVETESIRFKRSGIANDSETIQDIYTFREDITREYALRLNPMVEDADIPDIIAAKDAEDVTGMDDPDEMEEAVRRAQSDGDPDGV